MTTLSKAQTEKPTINTMLNVYRFDLDNTKQATDYAELRAKLDKSHKQFFFNVLENPSNNRHKLVSGPVALETKCLFNNQWNTNTDRVFDWYEAIYPNKKIKAGHYLTQTDEMLAIRNDVFKCGYCGGYGDGPDFHTACLKSEYLEVSNLPLLRMRKINDDKGNSKPLSPADKAYLMPLFEAAQNQRLKEKAIKMQAYIIDRLQKEVSQAGTKLECFSALLNAGIDTENCIYYAHKNTFTFGWRKPLSDSEMEALKAKIADRLPSHVFNFEFI